MNKLFKVSNICILCVALFLASCTDMEAPKVEQQEEPAQEEASATSLQQISIAAMKFEPSTIMFNIGDTLIFTNNDLVEHNVTQFPDATWASPTLKSGESWTFVPTQNDSFYCSIHPTMKGNIEIR